MSILSLIILLELPRPTTRSQTLQISLIIPSFYMCKIYSCNMCYFSAMPKYVIVVIALSSALVIMLISLFFIYR